MTAPSIGRPYFLSVPEVLSLQEVAIDQAGGSHGLRDAGLLDSAVAQARAGFGGEYAHAFPFEMAAACAFHLRKNHPFVDGDKRVAWAAAVAFLEANGWEVVAGQDEAADFMLRVAEGRAAKAEIASWLAERCRPKPSLELRGFFGLLSAEVFAAAYSSLAPSAPTPRGSEFAQTVADASLSMPFLADLWRQQAEASERGDSAQRERITALIVGMLALYRLAEDMGYEW